MDEPFVVISGDALTDFQLSEGITFHKQKKRTVTMFVKEVENPLSFGLVVMNKEQEVTRYIEKPSWNEVVSNIVNTGIYIMEPEIFLTYRPENFLILVKMCFRYWQIRTHYLHICQKVTG